MVVTKFLFSAILGLILQLNAIAQLSVPDSLNSALHSVKDDTIGVNILLSLSHYYLSHAPEKAKDYGFKGLNLARKLNFQSGRALAFKYIGDANYILGDFSATIEEYSQSLAILDSIGDLINKAKILNNFGVLYNSIGDEIKRLIIFLSH